MTNEQKALGGARTSTRAAQVVSDACTNTTTSCDACQIRISGFLHHGADNPVSCRELENLTGWRPREITRAIERERRKGIPILANGSGYFLPAADYEVDAYLRSLQHREREIRRTRAAVAATRQQTMNL